MKFAFTLLAVFASFIIAMHAQTVVKENVVKIPSTNALTESIVIPSGLALTINAGATITNNGTATGFGSGGTWGSITGTLSAQTDLQSALDQKLSLSSAASNYAPIANPTFTGVVTVPGAAGLRINAGGGITQVDFFDSTLSRTYLRAASFSGVKTVTIPATTGTLITTGDTGTVTSAMLAGSIDPSKITGTAAILGANTFTAAQVVDGSADAIQLMVQGHSSQTANPLVVEDSAGTDLFWVTPAGKVFSGFSGGPSFCGTDSGTGFRPVTDRMDAWIQGSVIFTAYANRFEMNGLPIQMAEQAAPSNPPANTVQIYAEDNGSGKTRLMAIFSTGAAQQIAIEP